jgi:hypothetical protein
MKDTWQRTNTIGTGGTGGTACNAYKTTNKSIGSVGSGGGGGGGCNGGGAAGGSGASGGAGSSYVIPPNTIDTKYSSDTTGSPSVVITYIYYPPLITNKNDSYSYTGTPETWIVPPGVTAATFTVIGGKGGDSTFSNAGYGSFGSNVTTTLSGLKEGDIYNIHVGNNGENGIINRTCSGGSSSDSNNAFGGGMGNIAGGGGAASFVSLNNVPVIIASGGGGGSDDLNDGRGRLLFEDSQSVGDGGERGVEGGLHRREHCENGVGVGVGGGLFADGLGDFVSDVGCGGTDHCGGGSRCRGEGCRGGGGRVSGGGNAVGGLLGIFGFAGWHRREGEFLRNLS